MLTNAVLLNYVSPLSDIMRNCNFHQTGVMHEWFSDKIRRSVWGHPSLNQVSQVSTICTPHSHIH